MKELHSNYFLRGFCKSYEQFVIKLLDNLDNKKNQVNKVIE